jgi:hypothetical protein
VPLNNRGPSADTTLARSLLERQIRIQDKVIDVERSFGIGQAFSRAGGRFDLGSEYRFLCE